MLYSQKEQQALIKGKGLIEQISAYQPPICPFKLNGCTTVNDAGKYVSVSSAVVLNSLPLSHNWKAAYNRLLEYKLYLQKIKSE